MGRKHLMGFLVAAMAASTAVWAQRPAEFTGGISENFEQGRADGWHMDEGWQVAQTPDGQWALRGTGHTWAEYAEGRWADFTLRFRLKLVRGGIHINCRTSGPNRYFIGLRQEAVYLMKQTGPESFSGELAHGEVPGGLAPGEWHNIAVVANGGSLTVTVDGATALTYTDPEPLGAGGIAFETLEETEAWIDDIAVSPVGAETPHVAEEHPFEQPETPAREVAMRERPSAGGMSESFSEGHPDGWELHPGWQVAQYAAGQWSLRGTQHSWARFDPGMWSDFTLRCRLRIMRGAVHINYRVSGPNRYFIGFNQEALYLMKQMGDEFTDLAHGQRGLTLNEWHQVAISGTGGNLTVLVDGATTLTYSDPQPIIHGGIAFEALDDTEVWVDDVAVVPAGGAKEPGTHVAEITPARGPAGPELGPGPAAAGELLAARIGRGENILAILAPQLTMNLRNAGINQPADLVQRIQSEANLTSLSQGTGVSTEELLFLAREADLARAIGLPNLTREEMALLRRMDLETPRQIAKYQGRAQQLQGQLAERASEFGVRPPSVQRVNQWISAALQAQPGLPQLEALGAKTPQTTALLGSPPRQVWLGEGRRPMPRAQRLAAGAGPATALAQPIAPGGIMTAKIVPLPVQVAIQPGQELDHEFTAPAPGLYRVEFSLQRKGGAAELDWAIQKRVLTVGSAPRTGTAPVEAGGGAAVRGRGPAGQLGRVATRAEIAGGYVPVISGGPRILTDVPGVVKLAYFWLKASDIVSGQKMRLHMKVVVNRDQGAGIDDAIEQMQKTQQGQSDRTVRGTVRIAHESPTPIKYGASTTVPFRNPQNVANSQYPIAVVEAPRFQQSTAGQNPWGLTARLEPTPNTYAPHMVDTHTGAPSQYDPGQIYGGVVLCDDTPVQGNWQDDKGIKTFKSGQPQTGVYHILVGPYRPKFNKLCTTGEVIGRWNPAQYYGANSIQQIKVTLSLDGGGKLSPALYVAELIELELSQQAEEDEWGQDNDEGPGEFSVDASSILTKRVTDVKAKHYGPAPERLVRASKWPRKGGHVHIREAPDGAIVTYPNYPVAWWKQDELGKYDNLGMMVRVWEDDEASSWVVIKHILGILSKAGKAIVAAWKGDAEGFITSMKDYILAIAKDVPIGEDDDPMGYLGFATTKQMEWGYLDDPPELLFDIGGPSHREYLDKVAKASPKNRIAGYVTGDTGAPRNAKATIRMRKVPGLWSWAHVQLLDFTVSECLDTGSKQTPPMDVYLSGGYSQRLGRGFMTDFWGFHHEKHGNWWDLWKVQAKVPFKVEDPAPPPTHKQGNVVLPGQWELPTWQIDPMPFTYYQTGFWDADPGGDQMIGMFSYTFYHDDIRKNVLAHNGKWISLSPANMPSPDMARFAKEGHFYTAEYKLHNLGNWLQEIHLKIWVYIWEK